MQGERKWDRDPTSSGLEAEGGRATEREEDQRESGVMEEWKRPGQTRGHKGCEFPTPNEWSAWGKALRHRGVRTEAAVLLHWRVPLRLRGLRLACT